MKVSVSLPNDDIAFLDAYAQSNGVSSRSAVLQLAVRMLQAAELESAYEDAWATWAESDDGRLWERTTADGLA